GIGAHDRVGAARTLRAEDAQTVEDEPRRRILERGAGQFPHVTLARFSARAPAGEGLARWLARHAAFSAAPSEAPQAVLYRSRLGESGPHYDALMEIPLAAPPRPAEGPA
ncbi:MAG: hypothetical protein AAFU61_10405, partial [Pseudomonadota bacterium]